MSRLIGISANLSAFLDTIAYSEIGQTLLRNSDDGYNVLVGGGLFQSYADHPNIPVTLVKLGITSTAAGRYQLLRRYYVAYKASLNLPDFSPVSQDAIAIQQIKECHALDAIEAGNVRIAIVACAHIWASLPGSPYGQHVNKMDDLVTTYLFAGGGVQ